MWGHVAACRCGVCSTLKRVCRHIADFSPKPGYVPFAADRLRVLAGELCDWGDSFYASGAAPPEAIKPPQEEPEREDKESVRGEADLLRREESKASSRKEEAPRTKKEEKHRSHRERRGDRHRESGGDRSVKSKQEPSEDSAFNTEEAALRTTAPKSACVGKPENKAASDELEVEESEKVCTEKEASEEEDEEGDVREKKEPRSPRSPSVRDRKRSRRTRSRSRRRRRRQEESEQRHRDIEQHEDREEVERAREGHSSSAHPRDRPRPTRKAIVGQFRGSPKAPIEAVGEAGLGTPLQGGGISRIGQTKV